MFTSIIIPTRNRYDLLNQLILDLLNQDVNNFEIIVVDQSATPQKVNHCKHIILKSLGPCISRNIGAENAKGEILVFLDDDARIEKDFISEITKPIIINRFDAVAGAICDINGNYLEKKSYFKRSSDSNFIKAITSNPNIKESRICLSFPGGCSSILKSVFFKVGGFDERFDPTGAGEDRDFALKLFVNGNPTWYNHKAKLLHIGASHGGSRDLGSRSIMLDYHTYLMSKKNFSEDVSEQLRKSIISKYKSYFIVAIFNMKLPRTKYSNYRKIRKLLKKIE